MAALDVKTPEPGFGKRWFREALSLLVANPAAFAIYLLVMPLAGIAREMILTSGMPAAIVISFITMTFIGSAVGVAMSFVFRKADGLPAPRIVWGTVKVVLAHMLFVIMGVTIATTLISTFLVIPNEGKGDWGLAAIHGYNGFFVVAMVFAAFGPSLLALVAAGVDGGVNIQTSFRVLDKLKARDKFIVIKFFIPIVIIQAFDSLSLFAGPLVIAMAYVATREMLNWPGAKSVREARGAVPQAT